MSVFDLLGINDRENVQNMILTVASTLMHYYLPYPGVNLIAYKVRGTALVSIIVTTFPFHIPEILSHRVCSDYKERSLICIKGRYKICRKKMIDV